MDTNYNPNWQVEAQRNKIAENRRTAKEVRVARARVNDALHTLGLTYHESIPLYAIDVILTDNGFDPQSEGIFTGRDGKHSEPIGHGTWLHMTWHFMEVTRRWEVVAYVN